MFNEIYGVVDPDNYHLIYDISEYSDRFELYDANIYDEEAPEKSLIDLSDVVGRSKEEMRKYILRGYLSHLNRSELSWLGMSRIETFMSLLAFGVPTKLSIGTNNTIVGKKPKKVIKKNKLSDEAWEPSLIEFIFILSKETGESEITIVQNIMKLHYARIVHGVFQNKIQFNSPDSFGYWSIWNFFEKKKWSRVSYVFDDGTALSSLEPSVYLREWMRPLGQGEQIFPVKKLDGISKMHMFLKKVIPFRDLLLNYIGLIKIKKIVDDKKGGSISNHIRDRLIFTENVDWINSKIWDLVYASESYDFGVFFQDIKIRKGGFLCPVCGHEKYIAYPNRFYCANKMCQFSFLRKNLRKMGVSSISMRDFVLAVSLSNVQVRASGGGLLYGELSSIGSTYFIHVYNNLEDSEKFKKDRGKKPASCHN